MMPQALRYLVVVVMGLGMDLGVAILLVKGGAPTLLASAIGLVCGAVSNFVMHRIWTFRTAELPPPFPQILGYIASVAIIFPVRLAVLATLQYLPIFVDDTLALILATGVSFVVNFFVLKSLVFRKRAEP